MFGLRRDDKLYAGSPLEKYDQHCGHAKRRGVKFLLTYEEWWLVWKQSGKWHRRGRRRGQYVMARFGDKGPYAVGNVKIITAAANLKERKASAFTRKKIGAAQRGKIVSKKTRAKLRAALTGRVNGPPSLATRKKIRAAVTRSWKYRERTWRWSTR
jgi:hypothetical protein